MELWTCASCGGENPAGMRFCGHCGTPRPTEVADTLGEAAPPPPEPSRPTEERGLITALFADISGFTALAQRVDSEELQAIIDPIIANAMRRPVKAKSNPNSDGWCLRAPVPPG